MKKIQIKQTNTIKDISWKKLTKEEIGNGRSIPTGEIEFLIKKLSPKKSSGPDGCNGKFYKKFKELISILHKLFKKQKGKVQYPAHSPRLELYRYQNKTKKNTRKNKTKIPQTNIFYKYECRSPQQNTNRIQQCIFKNIVHHNQAEFIPGMQGWFDI